MKFRYCIVIILIVALSCFVRIVQRIKAECVLSERDGISTTVEFIHKAYPYIQIKSVKIFIDPPCSTLNKLSVSAIPCYLIGDIYDQQMNADIIYIHDGSQNEMALMFNCKNGQIVKYLDRNNAYASAQIISNSADRSREISRIIKIFDIGKVHDIIGTVNSMCNVVVVDQNGKFKELDICINSTTNRLELLMPHQ